MEIVSIILWTAIILGSLAFLVSVITQVTKDIWFFAKISTQLQSLVLSVVLSVVAYFMYVSYTGKDVLWYFVVGAIMIGFIVALIVEKGWSYVLKLFQRFVNVDVVKDIKDVANNITDKKV